LQWKVERFEKPKERDKKTTSNPKELKKGNPLREKLFCESSDEWNFLKAHLPSGLHLLHRRGDVHGVWTQITFLIIHPKR